MPLFVCTLVVSALGATLRNLQLQYAFDEAGLPVTGSGLTIALAAVCLLGVLILLPGCKALPGRKAFSDNFPPCAVCFGLSAVGAAAILIGSAGSVWQAMPFGASILDLLPGFLGVFAALCIFMAAYGKYKGAKPMAALYLVPFFFAAVRLVLDFKNGWSSDPIILDYCFEMFAMLFAMTALYHLAGFCFDRGLRARTAFWSLAGVELCAVSIADGGACNMLVFSGLALWLLTNAWQLLRQEEPEE